MTFSRLKLPVLVAVLSMGFISQSPLTEKSVRRISSADCATCNENRSRAFATQIGATPELIYPFIQDSTFQQSSDMFSMFSQQLDFQSKANNFKSFANWSVINSFYPSPITARAFVFPSYALPTLKSVNPTAAPDTSRQIFGGLYSDPALQYLVQPLKASPPDQYSVTFGNSAVAPAALAAPTPKEVSFNIPPTPAKADAAPGQLTESSLLGSRPVPAIATPSVSFVNYHVFKK